MAMDSKDSTAFRVQLPSSSADTKARARLVYHPSAISFLVFPAIPFSACSSSGSFDSSVSGRSERRVECLPAKRERKSSPERYPCELRGFDSQFAVYSIRDVITLKLSVYALTQDTKGVRPPLLPL